MDKKWSKLTSGPLLPPPTFADIAARNGVDKKESDIQRNSALKQSGLQSGSPGKQLTESPVMSIPTSQL